MPTATRFISRIQDCDDYADALSWASLQTFSSLIASGTVTAEQLTSTDDATITDLLSAARGDFISASISADILNLKGKSSLVLISFNGTGLNDLALSGTYTGRVQREYRVEIDSDGSPNRFKWSNDDGSTWEVQGVAITGATQTLENGIIVTFGATTGHTVGDYWRIGAEAYTGTPFDYQDPAGTTQFEVNNVGELIIDITASGDATNTGIDITVSGADDNNAITIDGGDLWFKDDILAAFGTAKDATITFDSDSLNIVANAITGTNELNITADGVHITLGSAAASDFTIDTTGFVYEGDNNRVGIGTATPHESFVVADSVIAASIRSIYMGTAVFTGVNTGNFGLHVMGASDALQGARPIFGAIRARGTLASPTAVVNGNDMFSFLSAGFDGTGLEYPAMINFRVDGAVSTGVIPTEISFFTGSNSGNRTERLIISSDGNLQLPIDSQLLQFGAAQDYTIQWDGDDAVHTITAGDFAFMGGNVGIGTVSPNAPLEVKGTKPGVVGGFQAGMFQVTAAETAQFSNSVITGHSAYNTNTQLWYLGNVSGSDNNIGFINRQDADIHFLTNNTLKMVIKAAGNVGIRTATPHYPLTVGGGIGGLEKSADPAEPAEGEFVIWMSDGTGKGDDGDVLIASKAGAAIKWATLFDHSSGAGW